MRVAPLPSAAAFVRVCLVLAVLAFGPAAVVYAQATDSAEVEQVDADTTHADATHAEGDHSDGEEHHGGDEHAGDEHHDDGHGDDEHHGDEAHGGAHGDDHGGGHGHGPPPPIWLCIPFAALLLLIATGPIFFPHHWHHHYPKYAVALGTLVMAYFLVQGDTLPLIHAAEEYFSFIALLASLFIASGGILIKTDFAGTPKANAALLFVGAVISNVIGTTGASMLLIRPYMRLNKGRIKPYHIIFFIFIVSNVGGALTPIGDPPLFLGFLRGVPFFWTVTQIWYVWLPTILILLAVFYAFDMRNKTPAEQTTEGTTGGSKIEIQGTKNFAWLAVVIASVFIDPNIIPAMKGTILDLKGTFHIPFGIREVIMFGVCYLAYTTADKGALKGNDFNFEPIREVAWLFVGIFATMQPALTLIGEWARDNAEAIGVTTFYFGTGILSGVLDNAPTYVSFLSAAMGKFELDVNQTADVMAFATQDPEWAFYLQAISVAAVFFGALTYIGNGPNFMVKAIAESSGVECPSFGGYMIRYSIPILLPIYAVVWLVFFSGYVLPTPAEVADATAALFGVLP
ncbi:MAG: sodium:proton antiporter [Bacteroidota bacterium]